MPPHTQMPSCVGVVGVGMHGLIIQRADSFVDFRVHQPKGTKYLAVIFQFSLNISDAPLLYKIQSRKRKKKTTLIRKDTKDNVST